VTEHITKTAPEANTYTESNNQWIRCDSIAPIRFIYIYYTDILLAVEIQQLSLHQKVPFYPGSTPIHNTLPIQATKQGTNTQGE